MGLKAEPQEKSLQATPFRLLGNVGTLSQLFLPTSKLSGKEMQSERQCIVESHLKLF